MLAIVMFALTDTVCQIITFKRPQMIQFEFLTYIGIPAALCGTDGRSCHFHCTVLAARCGVGACLCLGFFIDLCQTRVGRWCHKTNVRWSGGRHGELLILENHVDLTLFGRHDFSRVNNSLCLPPYHLTFV